MNKLTKILLIIAIFLSGLSYSSPINAELIITRSQISDIKDGKATLEWRTNIPTKGVIYYGLDPDDLDIRLGYSAFSYNHKLILQGLEKKETYYYKIIAEDKSNYKIEPFLQNFSTKDMADTIKPKFTYKKLEQVTANAAALRWSTNEKTRAIVTYGLEYSDDKPKTKSIRSLKTDHILYVYDLKPQNKYFARVEIIDDDDNSWYHTFYFIPRGGIIDGSMFKIYNIKPQNYDAQLISPTSAIIKWKTTLVSKSYLTYSPKLNSSGKKVNSNDKAYSLSHEVRLVDLEPSTTYFFKIKASDSLYKKSDNIDKFSFKTPPLQQVSGTKITSQNSEDTDGDGLSDSRELSFGTDPTNPDTDNDSYPDGLEVANNYNPNGYGRIASQVYANPDILNNFEHNKANELKANLERNRDKLNIGWHNWFVLTNAYTHGGYSTQAISKTIEFSGKTVHPTIPRSAWQQTIEYQIYINK